MNDVTYFRNLPIDPTHLPSVADIDFVPIESRYVKIIYWNVLIIFTLLAVPIYFIGRSEGFGSLICLSYILCWILCISALLVTAPILVSKRKYALREKDIHYQKGWLWQRQTSIPFHRIQHAEINRGVFSRTLGLSELKVYTAGGSTSDLAIPGLPQETAQSMKAYIISKTELIADEEE